MSRSSVCDQQHRRGHRSAWLGIWAFFLACAAAAWGLMPLLPIVFPELRGDGQGGIAYLVWWMVLPFATGAIAILVTAHWMRRLAYTGASALGCYAGLVINADWGASLDLVFPLVLIWAAVFLTCCGGIVGLIIRGCWTLVFGKPTGKDQPGHCSYCGYDLTGNVSGRCPECGAEVGNSGGTS